MKISEAEVRYVADLANLKLTAGETARMAREMDEILKYMEKLNEMDTSAVEPMAQVLYEAGETATLRADAERGTLTHHDAIANAAVAGRGHFKVPKVIERG